MSYLPLRRSDRLRATICEKRVGENKKRILEITKLLGQGFSRANMKERIERLTKIMRILVKEFKYLLLYGIDDIQLEPLAEVAKMFKNIYFRTFVWMKESDEEPGAQEALGKQVDKYRKIYKAYRLTNMGIVRDAFGLTDDLLDVIDSYL